MIVASCTAFFKHLPKPFSNNWFFSHVKAWGKKKTINPANYLFIECAYVFPRLLVLLVVRFEELVTSLSWCSGVKLIKWAPIKVSGLGPWGSSAGFRKVSRKNSFAIACWCLFVEHATKNLERAYKKLFFDIFSEAPTKRKKNSMRRSHFLSTGNWWN